MSGFFFPKREVRIQDVEPGKVRRGILARGGSLMMVEVEFTAGAEGAEHSHPHDQVTYCLRGRFSFRVGESESVLEPGDSVFIPGGERHGVVCLSAGILLDSFSPQREDFLKA